jgi:prepilin-type N-terminal cleavage/methylation domain-containing protein
MRALRGLPHDQRGFTLAELLITIAILGLVMAAVLGVQMSSSTMFLRGENQAEAQQGARAAMLMEEDLRMVGYGCPDSGCVQPAPAIACWSVPAASPPATPPAACTTTLGKITAASATAVTFWADTQNASTTLSQVGGVAVGATSIPVTSAAGIAVNDYIYLCNGANWDYQKVTVITGNTLTVATGTKYAYPQGVLVGRPRAITYSYAANTLSRDAGDGNGLQALATGVTGLSFTYYVQPDPCPCPPGLALTAPVPAASLSTIGRILISTSTQSALTASGYSSFSINANVRPRNL